MAYGRIDILPSGSHKPIYQGGQEFPTLAVLNPNDGVVYLAENRDALSANYGDWDWKVPSQSYALLPGTPNWRSVGMYFLDQSGAGRQGEITTYILYNKIPMPHFAAIGRALIAVQTTLDITEGAIPVSPGSGILRLWADGSDLLHALSGGGQDRTLIDSVRPLGGVLSGFMPTPGFAASAVSNSAFSSISSAASTTSATASLLDTISFTTLTANSSVRLDWQGNAYATLNNTLVTIYLRLDGGAWSPVGRGNVATGGIGFDVPLSVFYEWFNLTAGAHTFDVGWATSQGTASFDTGTFRQIGIRELRV